MKRRPKDIGTAAEAAVVRYLRGNGFAQAERRALAGAGDLGDVTGTPGVCWEIKGGAAAEAASDLLIAAWLAETERERTHSGADHGVLIVKRRGIGPANCGAWWAIMPGHAWLALATNTNRVAVTHHHSPVRVHLSYMVAELRSAGYGEPLPEAGVA